MKMPARRVIDPLEGSTVRAQGYPDAKLYENGSLRCVMTGSASMEPGELEDYVEKLERRIEILAKENAALTMTLNKLMRENMKLKSERKNLEKKLSLMDAHTPVRFDPELQKE